MVAWFDVFVWLLPPRSLASLTSMTPSVSIKLPVGDTIVSSKVTADSGILGNSWRVPAAGFLEKNSLEATSYGIC